MNSATGLHAPCQAATIKVVFLPTFLSPSPPSLQFAEDDADPSCEIKDVLRICAVETDANRPFFMHCLG
jgi:hypothetical protein